MGFDNKDKRYESVYARKVKAGKRRTYFFDVRQTKGDDFYVTITESTRRFNEEGYTRHKIFLYKEDFNRFLESLTDVVDHVKTELMPDYDYEEYSRRYEEEGEEGDDTSFNENKKTEEVEVKVTETIVKNEDHSEDEVDGEKW